MKKLAEKCGKPELPVSNQQSKIIAEIQELGNRLVEYVGEILNRPTSLDTLEIEVAHI